MYRCAEAVPAQVYAVRVYAQLLGCAGLVPDRGHRNIVYKGAADW